MGKNKKRKGLVPKDPAMTVLYLYLRIAKDNLKQARKNRQKEKKKTRIVKLETEIKKMRPETAVSHEVFGYLISQQVIKRSLTPKHYNSVEWNEGMTVSQLVEKVWGQNKVKA